MLKSNCICIILVIVAICVIAAIFIFCFCSKKNNYSRLGCEDFRGGAKPDFAKLKSLIRKIPDADISNDVINDTIDKVNNVDKYYSDQSLIDRNIKEIRYLIAQTNELPEDEKIQALNVVNNIETWWSELQNHETIKQLKSENKTLKDKIKDLEKVPSGSKIAELESENRYLRNRINELESNGDDWYGNIPNQYHISI